MSTKETIRCLLEAYENERTLRKIGLFFYLADYFEVHTFFYVQLHRFYKIDLNAHSQLEELDPGDMKKLWDMVYQHADLYPDDSELKQENPAIFQLFNSVRELVKEYKWDLEPSVQLQRS